MSSLMHMFRPIAMIKKGYKQTLEHKRKNVLGRLNSPIIKARKEETRKRNELKRQLKLQQRLQQIREEWSGYYFSPEAKQR